MEQVSLHRIRRRKGSGVWTGRFGSNVTVCFFCCCPSRGLGSCLSCVQRISRRALVRVKIGRRILCVWVFRWANDEADVLGASCRGRRSADSQISIFQTWWKRGGGKFQADTVFKSLRCKVKWVAGSVLTRPIGRSPWTGRRRSPRRPRPPP